MPKWEVLCGQHGDQQLSQQNLQMQLQRLSSMATAFLLILREIDAWQCTYCGNTSQPCEGYTTNIRLRARRRTACKLNWSSNRSKLVGRHQTWAIIGSNFDDAMFVFSCCSCCLGTDAPVVSSADWGRRVLLRDKISDGNQLAAIGWWAQAEQKNGAYTAHTKTRCLGTTLPYL